MSLALLATLVAGALAQKVSIGAPAAGATITVGQPFTVELDEPVRRA